MNGIVHPAFFPTFCYNFFKHTEKLKALCMKSQYTHHTVLLLVFHSVFSRDLSIKLDRSLTFKLNDS